ncbi:MAG: hypothetical protein WDN04_13965 [Rhodospirillales bacterium]
MGQGRRVGMAGVMPIAPTEIVAWCQLRDIALESWELSIIQGLDNAFVRIAAEK